VKFDPKEYTGLGIWTLMDDLTVEFDLDTTVCLENWTRLGLRLGKVRLG
jgi:hypothetical protein